MGKQYICSFKINKIQRHNAKKIYPYVCERIYAKRINKGINKEIGISTLFSKMMQVLYICTSFDINRTFFEKFKEYYGLVTNKFNRSIKAIRMNNGKEYINNMKSFLKKSVSRNSVGDSLLYATTEWLFRKA